MIPIVKFLNMYQYLKKIVLTKFWFTHYKNIQYFIRYTDHINIECIDSSSIYFFPWDIFLCIIAAMTC